MKWKEPKSTKDQNFGRSIIFSLFIYILDVNEFNKCLASKDIHERERESGSQRAKYQNNVTTFGSVRAKLTAPKNPKPTPFKSNFSSFFPRFLLVYTHLHDPISSHFSLISISLLVSICFTIAFVGFSFPQKWILSRSKPSSSITL